MSQMKRIMGAMLALAMLSLAVMFGAAKPEASESIVDTAEAADSCDPSTKGKYALRTLNNGNTTEPAYQSGPACKLSVCVTKGYMASKLGPPGCSDAANPLCGFPAWILGYTVQTGNTPAGTPTCDPYWNSTSRWAAPAN